MQNRQALGLGTYRVAGSGVYLLISTQYCRRTANNTREAPNPDPESGIGRYLNVLDCLMTPVLGSKVVLISLKARSAREFRE